jgi:serine/threonine protein kinase
MVELGPDKEFVKLWLIDFGCAKNFVNSQTIHVSTTAGSPFFEAPEVKEGKYGQCMQEVDIYSIGKTLLVAILGYNPQNIEIKVSGEWIASWKVPPEPQNSELVQMANKLIAEKPADRASLDDALNDFIGAFGHDATVEIQDFDFAVKQLLERKDLGFVGMLHPESRKKLTNEAGPSKRISRRREQ